MVLTALSAILFPLLIGLGCWQISRGGQKALALETLQGQVVPVSSLGDLPELAGSGVRVRLSGRFVEGADLLLDNQPLRGFPGLAVLTPFQLQEGGVVLTSRAWLSAAGDRADFASAVPPLLQSADAEVLAEIWPLPASMLDSSGARQGWPKVVQKLEIDELQNWFGTSLAAVVAWQLTPAAGFSLPATPSAGLTPLNHYGYAGQWFALAATLLVMYLWYGFSRARRRDHDD